MWNGKNVNGTFHDKFDIIYSLIKVMKECCHNPIWAVMWIGTDEKKCCQDKIGSAMWIGMMWQEAL
jgi:hypothetical protein